MGKSNAISMKDAAQALDWSSRYLRKIKNGVNSSGVYRIESSNAGYWIAVNDEDKSKTIYTRMINSIDSFTNTKKI